MAIADPGARTVSSRRCGLGGRAVQRLLGGLVVALSAVGLGAVVAAAPASASSGPGFAGTGAPLPANAPPGSASTVISTACPAAGNCIAVGAYGHGDLPTGLIETQSGGSWHATEAPAPPGAVGDELIAIACASVGNCVASGVWFDSGDHDHGEVAVEKGGSWTASNAPLPANAAANPMAELLNVACPAEGSCVIVGVYMSTALTETGVLLTQSGGAWTATEAPVPANAVLPTSAFVLNVFCAAPGSCEAVGEYEGPASAEFGLLLSLSGGTWRATQAPVPANAAPTEGAAVEGVSCSAADACMAVGAYRTTSGATLPMFESISGATVKATAAPLPANAATGGGTASLLFNLNCPSATACVAVGGYDTTAGPGVLPLIDTFSNGSWSTLQAPGNFNTSNQTALDAVSCSWPGSCSAFGVSVASHPTSSTGVIETLRNGSWTETSTVIPAGGSSPPHVSTGIPPEGFTIGTPIACTAGTCALAGSYMTVADLEMGFLNFSPNIGGYQTVAADGGLFSFNAPFYGSMGGQPLNQPVVGMATVPDSGGYYEVASDGGIFAFNAPFYGSMGGQHLNAPIVGIAFDPRTGGYYEVASDGGIFAFNAPFYGSMGGQPLNKPIVGIAFDPATGGYYEVASDGGIFAFNAPFDGSTGGLTLNKPVVGMAVDMATGGYYEVASDGGIFAFGAPFQGSTGALTLNKPVVGMAYDYVDRRLLRSGLRRRHLRLQRSLCRLDRKSRPQQAGRGDGLRLIRLRGGDRLATTDSFAPRPSARTFCRHRRRAGRARAGRSRGSKPTVFGPTARTNAANSSTGRSVANPFPVLGRMSVVRNGPPAAMPPSHRTWTRWGGRHVGASRVVARRDRPSPRR